MGPGSWVPLFHYAIRNFFNKCEKQLLDTASKTGLDRCSKNCFQKVVHKAAEPTGEFMGNTIVDKIVKPKPVIDENPRNVEVIAIQLEKWQEILNE